MKRAALLLFVLFSLANTGWAEKKTSHTVFPYVFYSGSSGTNYGLASVVVNSLKKDESFSLLLNFIGNGGYDTVGVASFPDRSLRYRTLFPLAVDLEIGNSRWINERYYGIGPSTALLNYSSYDLNYDLLKIAFSRAITNNLVMEADLVYNSGQYSNLVQGANPISQKLLDDSRKYYWASLGLVVNRTDNYLNPGQGENIRANLDFAVGGADFVRAKLDLRKFIPLQNPGQLLAGRLLFTEIAGGAVPLYEYPSLGGRDSLRGSPYYRYRGGSSILANLEYRFPLIWSLGGVLFFDAGKTFANLGAADLSAWPTDCGLGLRWYMEDLILRLDYGIGQEDSNIYFYYNHLF